MTVAQEPGDNVVFIEMVERLVNGMLLRHAPKALALIKIDSWFGSKWLGFSGKALGALGVWNKPYNAPAKDIRIPPFVPKRVVWQRRFVAPGYVESGPGKPIHIRVWSSIALTRKAARVEPETALVWYSGNSEKTGRGAVMAYVPVGDAYWPWYVSWKMEEQWHVAETWDIKPDDVTELMERGHVLRETR